MVLYYNRLQAPRVACAAMADLLTVSVTRLGNPSGEFVKNSPVHPRARQAHGAHEVHANLFKVCRGRFACSTQTYHSRAMSDIISLLHDQVDGALAAAPSKASGTLLPVSIFATRRLRFHNSRGSGPMMWQGLITSRTMERTILMYSSKDAPPTITITITGTRTTLISSSTTASRTTTSHQQQPRNHQNHIHCDYHHHHHHHQQQHGHHLDGGCF